MRKLKSRNGITLITLIITIIILLILAGVTINMILGENGLFNKTKTSVGIYENAYNEEQNVLNEIDNTIQKYFNQMKSECVITYDVNGGTGTIEPEKFNYAGNAVINTEPEIRKEGYTFLGWSTNKDAEEAIYKAHTECSIEELREDINLYAIWKKGLTAAQITNPASYIGRTVTGYGDNTTQTAQIWKIFDIEDNHIYLISKNSVYPSGHGTGDYNALFLKDSTNFDRNDSSKGKIDYLDETYGEAIVGAPTIERFASSYNKTHRGTYIRYNLYNGRYYVASANESNKGKDNSLYSGQQDRIYLPIDGVYNSGYVNGWYFLSAPSWYKGYMTGIVGQNIYMVASDHINPSGGYDSAFGIRPVITLYSDVILLEVNADTCELYQNIRE